MFTSLYHGDFEKIGDLLQEKTDGFKDFTLLTNIPYGVQSREKQHTSIRDTQNLYRRLGRFIQRVSVPVQETTTIEASQSELSVIRHDSLRNLEHAYVLARSTHFGHELSFEKYSNSGWQNMLHFSNGGISVNLLRFDMTRKSKVKHVIGAYKDMDRLSEDITKLN